MRITPLRLIILHLLHRFFTEGLTFIEISRWNPPTSIRGGKQLTSFVPY